MAEAIEERVAPGWLYVLVLGKPGEGESVNMVSNAPSEQQAELLEMLQELVRRSESGVTPKEL
jgi:hypothetical protein